jgi:soluble lytic murein transglycosylase-like protein
MPDRAAAANFARCRDEARKVIERDGGAVPARALELAVECSTEAGDLDAALTAWRRLEASGWGDGRRSWLGRRLGVALARAGAPAELIDELAGALPRDARCLRYWHSIRDPIKLDVLADVEVDDLYARWARIRVVRAPATDRPVGRPAAGAAIPTRSVAWLLEHGTVGEASDEWQRINRDRRPTVAEAVGAAALAVRAGRPNTAIRTALQVAPDLGSVAISDAPTDLVAVYLPLRWEDAIVRAAADTGLDPWLIAAVARQESTFTAHARSPAGAHGVLQLLPSTARGHARALGLGTRPDLTDPAVNIAIGARELAWLVRRFGELEPALAAYNAGETRVRRWWRRWPDREIFTESIPIPETYTYVRRVIFLADAYRRVHADAWRTAR